MNNIIDLTPVAAINVGNVSAVMTYDYTIVTGITIANDVYEQVGALITPIREAGIYQLELSMLHTLNSTNTSAYFRVSTDGGTNWLEIRREPKDVTDKDVRSYPSTLVHAGGILNIIVQARKENAVDILILEKLDIMLNRKS